MANQFDTEVLRRSLSRNPNTLLDYANLPDVQPGPSAGVYFAEAIGNLMEGAGDQFLKSKELDYKFQGQAIQGAIAQDTLNLNVDKLDFEKEVYDINEANEHIKEMGFEAVGKILNSEDSGHPDTPRGRAEKSRLKIRYDEVKKEYDWAKSFEGKITGLDVTDILKINEPIYLDPNNKNVEPIGYVTGSQMLDRYSAFQNPDKAFNAPPNPQALLKFKEYNDHRSWYDLIKDETLAKKVFKLGENDYQKLLAADPEEGDNMLTAMIMHNNPSANPNYVKNLKDQVIMNQGEIRGNNSTISNLVREYAEIKTTDARREVIAGKYNEDGELVEEGLIHKFMKENERLKMGAPPAEEVKDKAVIQTGRLKIGDKIFEVGYNKDNVEVTRKEITVKGPPGPKVDVDDDVIPPKVDEDVVPKISFQEVQSVLDSRELHKFQTELSKIWRNAGGVRNESGQMEISLNDPAVIKLLEDKFNYFKRLKGEASVSPPSTIFSPPPININ